MRRFQQLPLAKQDERKRIVADAQKVATIYKEMIQSVCKEMELPPDASIVDFMGWLANEVATLSDHMAVG